MLVTNIIIKIISITDSIGLVKKSTHQGKRLNAVDSPNISNNFGVLNKLYNTDNIPHLIIGDDRNIPIDIKVISRGLLKNMSNK
jgi:hypothetical protein